MDILYNFVISVLQSLAFLLAPFHPKLKKWKSGQEGVFNSISDFGFLISDSQLTTHNSKLTTHNSKKTIWFHAASLGEFEQGRPVIEAFRRVRPDWKIVLTFFSPSGYEIRKDYDQVDLVCYLPTDTKENVNRFLDIIQPDLVCFIKYEFWYNYLITLKNRNIPTFLISAIFRPNQLFFNKWLSGFHRKMLFCFDTIFVQNTESKNLLELVGYQNVVISGDTRLDRVIDISKSVKKIPEIEQFKADLPLLVIGSAWPDDMEVLIPFINNFKKPLKIIIAPHEIDSKQIDKWRSLLKVDSSLWREVSQESRVESGTPPGPESTVDGQKSIVHSPQSKLLFLDTIGLLSSVYQYADFAYIGGAFKDGLHNILEPAVFGLPIFFGDKKYDKFQEATDLLKLGVAQTISNSEEMTQKFNEIYDNIELQKEITAKIESYINQNAGATGKVIDILLGSTG